MDIEVVYGVVHNRWNEKEGKVQVLAYKEKLRDALIVNELTIEETFPKDGSVYSAMLFTGADQALDKGDFVELRVTSIHRDKVEEGKSVKVHHQPNVKRAGSRIFICTSDIFNEKERFIDMNTVMSELRISTNPFPDLAEFYISDKIHLWGPFKSRSEMVEAKTGREVARFLPGDITMLKGLGNMYILGRPTKKISEVDCMNRRQVLDWLKTKINEYGDFSAPVNQIVKALSNKDITFNSELDISRFNRAKDYIVKIDLSFQEIRKMSELTVSWQQVFIKTLERHVDDAKIEAKKSIRADLGNYEQAIRDEFDKKRKPLDLEIQELQKVRKTLIEMVEKERRVIKKYNIDVGLLQVEIDRMDKVRSSKLEDLNYVTEQKDRLIKDIRIHSQLEEQQKTDLVREVVIPNYEEQTYVSTSQEYYQNYEEMLDITKQTNIKNGNVGNTEIFESIFHGLLTYNYLLTRDETLVIYFAKLFGNSKVIIQQVEPDWTKFNKLYENGLRAVWESATRHPDQFHFLVLQDINLSSIECYGKPLLDVIRGIRQSIPGFGNPIPKNLYIIGVPLKVGQHEEFGLNIYKATFDNWGVLKDYSVKISAVSNFNAPKILRIDMIQDMLDDLNYKEDSRLLDQFFNV
jgi:hypothetical protein